MSEQKTDGDELRVAPATGRNAEGRIVYKPLSVAALRSDRRVPFPIYVRPDQGRLVQLFPAGWTPQIYPGSPDQKKLRDWDHLYVRSDEKKALSSYYESIMPDVLNDPDIPTNEKCVVLQSQTSLLSEALFESPKAPQIRRQKSHVNTTVDFVMREPQAMRALLGLTNYDYYTYTHSVNVGLYGTWLAIEVFGTKQERRIKELASGFFLHDIGKSRVPNEILNKPGKLDEDEWEIMRKHPQYGHDILDEEGELTEESSIIVSQHHERMDAKGYPLGLSGGDIHPYARICSMVDAYDALTTQRSYKPAKEPFVALQIMKEEMHQQFDPDIFQSFVLLSQRKREQFT